MTLRQRPLGPDDPRNPARRSKHGLTAQEVDELIALQGGCAVCHRRDRPLQIDHDHRHCPGPVGCRLCVRGALCGRCNKAMWCLDDDVHMAENMVTYMKRTRDPR